MCRIILHTCKWIADDKALGTIPQWISAMVALFAVVYFSPVAQLANLKENYATLEQNYRSLTEVDKKIMHEIAVASCKNFMLNLSLGTANAIKNNATLGIVTGKIFSFNDIISGAIDSSGSGLSNVEREHLSVFVDSFFLKRPSAITLVDINKIKNAIGEDGKSGFIEQLFGADLSNDVRGTFIQECQNRMIDDGSHFLRE